ncbi:MAG: dTDP-glucose 4,6-dehydratase [Patescibacteria group bacterium]|jgi:dTDP-glucose 4,6-dehydratase
MKILITGGLGFIGSNFIRRWMKNHPGDQIVNLDKVTYAANPVSLNDLESNSDYTFIKGDICDPVVVEEAMNGVNIVVHFAAESHVDRSIDDPTLFVKTNVLGTYILLQSALNNKISRFHHVSTDEVFGSITLDSGDQFRESTPYNPSSPYSASKASSDHFVRAFAKTFKLPITISNCSNNYGPYQNPEKFIPRMITNLLDGKKVPVYGQGLNLRDWLYVDDHCSAIETVIMKGKIGETYCVGGLKGGESNIKIVKTVLKILNLDESWIEYVPDRPAHDNYSVDWTKINQDLGWQPSFDLESGLKATIDWYKTHESWWRNSKNEAENFYQKLSQKAL